MRSTHFCYMRYGFACMQLDIEICVCSMFILHESLDVYTYLSTYGLICLGEQVSVECKLLKCSDVTVEIQADAFQQEQKNIV